MTFLNSRVNVAENNVMFWVIWSLLCMAFLLLSVDRVKILILATFLFKYFQLIRTKLGSLSECVINNQQTIPLEIAYDGLWTLNNQWVLTCFSFALNISYAQRGSLTPKSIYSLSIEHCTTSDDTFKDSKPLVPKCTFLISSIKSTLSRSTCCADP